MYTKLVLSHLELKKKKKGLFNMGIIQMAVMMLHRCHEYV